MLAYHADKRQWAQKNGKNEAKSEMRSVGKKVFGNGCVAMCFGIGVSGADAEIAKTVFELYFRRELGNACHDLAEKITNFEKFATGIFFR